MEILSLKWNNHQIVFSHQMNELRKKTSYTDTTLACHGKFYQAHKLVLSTCSDYFKEIFNHITCNNPVIVLKDISCQDLEFLLDYMYIGEVNVKKNELKSLISAAENLQIKGLAASDESCSSTDHDLDQNNKKNSSTLSVDQDYIKESAVKSPSTNINKGLLNKAIFETDYVLSNENSNFVQNELQGPYVNDIKSDPDLSNNCINNELKTEPCTSNTEEISCQDYAAQTKFSFFPSDADFPESLAQDDVSLHSQKDLPNTLPHGPYLQLPFSGYIRRDSTMNRDKNNRDLVKRDYTCTYCGRAFSHRTNQLAHERIHTGEKPFKCLYCSFRTALKGNLKNHVFSRHQADWKSIKHLILPTKDN